MDLTFIIDFIITFLLLILTTFLIPYLKTKFGVEKVQSAYSIIKILVNAVEQTTKVTGAGKQKKEWVTERLKDYNVSLDENKVSELIESAVLELDQNVNNENETK